MQGQKREIFQVAEPETGLAQKPVRGIHRQAGQAVNAPGENIPPSLCHATAAYALGAQRPRKLAAHNPVSGRPVALILA